MSAAARPYHLFGERRLRAVERQLRDVLGELIARWWPQADRLPVPVLALAPAEPSTLAGGTARLLLREGDRWLAVFTTDQDARQWAGGWLGTASGAGGALARRLEEQFHRELFTTLAGAVSPQVEAGVGTESLPGPIGLPGGGVLRIELAIAGAHHTWLAPPTLWTTPEISSPPRAGLVPVAAALGPCRVGLEVRLEGSGVPLATVAALAPGDFLDLGHDLSGRVRVTGTDIALALPAALGRRGEHKAVQIIDRENRS